MIKDFPNAQEQGQKITKLSSLNLNPSTKQNNIKQGHENFIKLCKDKDIIFQVLHWRWIFVALLLLKILL
jgi:phosphatidylethanolamine-binding protein (PEBP) family uncharacterized protein